MGSNASKNRLQSLGLYAGSTIPREMHLDINKQDLREFGKDIMSSLHLYVP